MSSPGCGPGMFCPDIAIAMKPVAQPLLREMQRRQAVLLDEAGRVAIEIRARMAIGPQAVD